MAIREKSEAAARGSPPPRFPRTVSAPPAEGFDRPPPPPPFLSFNVQFVRYYFYSILINIFSILSLHFKLRLTSSLISHLYHVSCFTIYCYYLLFIVTIFISTRYKLVHKEKVGCHDYDLLILSSLSPAKWVTIPGAPVQ